MHLSLWPLHLCYKPNSTLLLCMLCMKTAPRGLHGMPSRWDWPAGVQLEWLGLQTRPILAFALTRPSQADRSLACQGGPRPAFGVSQVTPRAAASEARFGYRKQTVAS